MTSVRLERAVKAYGQVRVIKEVDLSVNAGEFVVFVGPSGCGKSTLLRMIAGLTSFSSGDIFIDGDQVTQLPPAQRGVAMVFQSYALYPHLTVYENMAFGLRIARRPREEIDATVRRAAETLQLSSLLDRLPKALSGGQRQRVAIGRAICREPKVFLFDEPLSNLDAALRVATRIEIAALHKSLPGVSMIYVTHDQVEAMTLADRIVVLSAGRIEQVGAPMTLYETPENLFVARFIGSPAMNVLSADVAPNAARGAAHVGVRPEHLRLAAGPDSALFEGAVTLVERLGELSLVHLDVPGCADPITFKLTGTAEGISPGQSLSLAAEAPERLHRFDGEGRRIVSSST